LANAVENWVDLPPPVKILLDQLKFAVSFAKNDDDDVTSANSRSPARRERHLDGNDAAAGYNADGTFENELLGDSSNLIDGADSCEVAFPGCDFSFDKFVKEKIYRK
jgi:hypothetical protein